MFKSNNRKLLSLLLILMLALAVQSSAFAQGPDKLEVASSTLAVESAVHPAFHKAAGDGERLVSVIVKLEDDSLAAASSTVIGLDQLDVRSGESQAYLKYLDQKQRAFEKAALQKIPGGRVVHRYQVVFGGVSMIVPESEVDTLAELDGVVAVYRDKLRQVDTERSPQFIGAPVVWNALGGQESAGEGVIVGVIDTGIWPEHPSFSDPDPSGKPYPPPPAKWTGTSCEFGSDVPGDDPFTCNNKLIGATWSMATYEASGLLLDEEFRSARDDNGHGTHTTSTAAGNASVEASIFGMPRGTVSGIAPRAHVAMYKACGDLGCFTSDLLAAIEQAVADGVDVINYSIGGPATDPYDDPDSLAFLEAYASGIFVATSAGNSGPDPDTVGSPANAPWVTSVGASTSDRHFISTVSLEAGNGDTLVLEGASVTDGIDTPTPVVFPPAGEELCLEPFDPGTFNGEIVICERGEIARVAKSFNVAAGGAGGMFLYNPVLQGLATDNHFVPSVHLENDAGAALLDFMATHTGVAGTFTPGVATVVQGDKMAAFSSRGGPGQTLGISKPDVTAPGVQILAGHTPLPATVVGGLPGELFQSIQGTSMSSPHVAGAGALLKDLHPDWTPGQIKSALMTTAKTDGVFKEDGVTPADPFDHGSGRIDLTKAGSPGLTISETADNFVALQDELWNANYPSVYLPVMQGQMTVQRTVHSELDFNSRWATTVEAPPGVHITVPKLIDVPAGGSTTFDITIDARAVPVGEVFHAMLDLKLDPRHNRVRSVTTAHIPLTLVRGQQGLAVDKTCDPGTFAADDHTDCTITITNTSFDEATFSLTDQLPYPLQLDLGSVVGATARRNNQLTAEGTLFSAGPPGVDVLQDDLFGYLSLADLGVSPAGCPSNCDDGGFIVSGLDINYLGQHYTDAIWSVNGTLELGTESGVASSFANQHLPDPALPNNVLAPWWTDLNLDAGGNWYLATLTDGVSVWDVFEWENVPRWGDSSSTFSFQIWLERGTDNIHFTFGPFAGDTTDGTTGAEDASGMFGDSYYFDGTGVLPWGGPDLGVVSVPGTPGETHIITYTVLGNLGSRARVVPWTNCAEVTSNLFEDTSIVCFSGQVTP